MRFPAPELPGWLARHVPFERYAIEAGGRRFHVMEHGTGPQLVLCVHGNPTWSFLWRKVATALDPSRFRVVMPDLPGLGLSDRPAHHDLEQHLGWLGSLVDALALRRVLLVVQDWGGPIGVGAFLGREERLAGLVVLNTVLGPPRKGFRPTLFHRFARVPLLSTLAFRVVGFPQGWPMAFAQGDRRSISGEVARAYRFPLEDRRTNRAPLDLARMVPGSLSHASVPALERVNGLVRGFRGPAEIVWGDADPVLGRALKRVREALPDAPVTHTTAGHFLQEEVPNEIAAAVRRVADRLAA